jgi:predicted transcriptional regulator
MKKKITDLELKILQRIWQIQNRACVQEVLDSWKGGNKPRYTTILKTLQIMEKKGFVTHEKEGKAYKYIPTVTQKEISRKRMNEILNGFFSGNKPAFVNRFISDNDLCLEEIEKIKKLLDEKEKEVKRC